jgi:hypothetical protein
VSNLDARITSASSRNKPILVEFVTFFGKDHSEMDVAVAPRPFGGDNEGIVLNRDTMPPQVRWPHISTSVSGIAAEDWDAFKARAKVDGIKYRDALEQAIADLAVAARRGDEIDWQPVKVAPSRAVRMHDDTRNEINALVEEFQYKQNVVVATAMHRYTHRP